MKRMLVSMMLAGFAVVGTACAAEPELKTENDKTIYAMGLWVASRAQLASFHFTPAELDLLKAGIADGAAGTTPKVDLQTYLPKVQTFAQERLAAAAAVTAAAEKKKGKEFLDTIAAKDGVKKTGSGLLIETTKAGTGASPVPNDLVKVNYKGTLIDGKVFDASEKHGGPSTFTLDPSGLMKCWTEGLEFMKVGGSAKLYCPSDIAYGDNGRGADIPPGATLIFEIDLLEIVKPTAAPDKKK